MEPVARILDVLSAKGICITCLYLSVSLCKDYSDYFFKGPQLFSRVFMFLHPFMFLPLCLVPELCRKSLQYLEMKLCRFEGILNQRVRATGARALKYVQELAAGKQIYVFKSLS